MEWSGQTDGSYDDRLTEGAAQYRDTIQRKNCNFQTHPNPKPYFLLRISYFPGGNHDHTRYSQFLESIPQGWESTCDGIWYDWPDKPVRRIAVCFKITFSNLRQAIDWGTDLLITHEPMWPLYDREMHPDETDPVIREMDRLLRENRIAVLRLHDHAHLYPDDFIHMGFLTRLGLEIAHKADPMRLGFRQYTLAKPMTAREIGLLVQEKYNIAHPRLAGNIDIPLTKVTLALGGVGELGYGVLRDTDTELFISGEIGELGTAFWNHGAAKLGLTKAVMALGHCESERYGMEVLADWMEKQLAQEGSPAEVRYLDTEDTYVVL